LAVFALGVEEGEAVWRRPWWAVDGALAVGLLALAEAQLGVYEGCCRAGDGEVTPAAFVLTVLETLPVALRRRFPLPVLVVAGGAAIGQLALRSPITDFGTFGVLVAYYTVASVGARRLAIGLAAATPVGLGAALLLDPRLPLQELMFATAQFVAAWVLGDNARYRRRAVAYQAREAAEAERARIARELHDVVAHSLSLITLQAGAGRTVLDAAPERARECLAAIETVSREAWAEMRRFLDGAGSGARPGLERLAELIGRFEAAGLAVDLRVSGEARPLPPAADLCAYRVVQESLTNALRHAGTGVGGARVSIGYGRRSVEVEIANRRRQAPVRGGLPSGGHHGLSGLRERVGLVGGQLSVEDRSDGFTVRARLPAP
jgi:signal transduction histidine kinase